MTGTRTQFLLLILTCLFAIQSCEQTELAVPRSNTTAKLNTVFQQNQVTVQDGYLNFPSRASFYATLTAIQEEKPSDVELNTFEELIQFNSFRREYLSALDSYSSGEFSENSAYYNSIVRTDDFEPRISYTYIMPLVNSQRLIMINGMLYKYNEDAVITAGDGSILTIIEAEDSRSSTKMADYRQVKKEEPNLEKTGCSTSQWIWREDGRRAGRMNYKIERDVEREMIRVCDDMIVLEPNEDNELEPTIGSSCRDEFTTVGINLSFVVNGKSYQKVWPFGWNLYKTEHDLRGNVLIDVGDNTYQTDWDINESNTRRTGHSATWSPNLDEDNSFDVDEINVFFDTRGLGSGREIIVECD